MAEFWINFSIAVLVVAGLGIFALGCWTWVVVHQAASEAREWFRRQNAAGRIEDREADVIIDHERTQASEW